MTDLDQLRRHLQELGKVLLGYSGGVDSALLAVVGSQTLGAGGFLAVIGRSPSYPEAQWRTRGRSGRAVRRAAARARHPRARGPALPPQRHRSLLLLQGGAVDPSRGGRPPTELRHHHRRHQRGRSGRAPAGTAGGTRGRNPLAARGARLEQGGRAYGEPCAGPSHLGRTGRSLSLQPGAIRSGHHARPAAAGGGRRGVPPATGRRGGPARQTPRQTRQRRSRSPPRCRCCALGGRRWSAFSRGSGSSEWSWTRRGIDAAGS